MGCANYKPGFFPLPNPHSLNRLRNHFMVETRSAKPKLANPLPPTSKPKRPKQTKQYKYLSSLPPLPPSPEPSVTPLPPLPYPITSIPEQSPLEPSVPADQPIPLSPLSIPSPFLSCSSFILSQDITHLFACLSILDTTHMASNNNPSAPSDKIETSSNITPRSKFLSEPTKYKDSSCPEFANTPNSTHASPSYSYSSNP
ncbi:hypothetical protein VP01_2993g2 [Puccinia sorghi]|uniref:Uncharacterized protein n=1 Tax=Puccinia sorghi TaxID=27349 RepID=A0A0L6V275_9BASI|nr:hypothetical protein VP01_2993g2 [Puccinia sorghi]